jgi:hypothetical protein
MRHLVHIGYPKAGSKFLQEWFGHHPQLLYRKYALAGFYDYHQLAESMQRHERQPYRYAVSSWEGFTNGWEWVSPPVKMGKPAFVSRFLADYFPNAQILLITRGFVSRAVSTWKQAVRSGSPQSPSEIMDSLLAEDAAYFDYNKLVSAYERTFGKENVIVLPYELLRDDSGRFLQILQGKLGLDPIHHDPGVVNQASDEKDLYWYYHMYRWIYQLKSMAGVKWYDKIALLHRRFTKSGKYHRLFRILRLVFGDRKLVVPPLPPTFLAECRGKADILKGRAEFAGYEAEYLWD